MSLIQRLRDRVARWFAHEHFTGLLAGQMAIEHRTDRLENRCIALEQALREQAITLASRQLAVTHDWNRLIELEDRFNFAAERIARLEERFSPLPDDCGAKQRPELTHG